MRGIRSVSVASVATVLLLAATPADAQRPVCAPLGPGERVQPVCAPLSVYGALRFLADFTVDHHFKPAPPAIQRSAVEASQPVIGHLLRDNAGLKDFLAGLAPLRFIQLDRSTGSVLADFAAGPREFAGELSSVEGKPKVTLRLPATLQGGYWRAPDVLQIAFWNEQRLAVRAEYGSGRAFDAEVECIALSPDELLVRFDPPDQAPLLVKFRECDQ